MLPGWVTTWHVKGCLAAEETDGEERSGVSLSAGFVALHRLPSLHFPAFRYYPSCFGFGGHFVLWIFVVVVVSVASVINHSWSFKLYGLLLKPFSVVATSWLFLIAAAVIVVLVKELRC